MKRSYIWCICVVIGVSFLALLYLQSRYASAIVRMRREQFEESVFRSLDQASRDLEKAETFRYLQTVISQHDREKQEMSASDSLCRALPPTLQDTLQGLPGMQLVGKRPSQFPRCRGQAIWHAPSAICKSMCRRLTCMSAGCSTRSSMP